MFLAFRTFGISLDGLRQCGGDLNGAHCAYESGERDIRWPHGKSLHDTESSGDADLSDAVGFLHDSLLVLDGGFLLLKLLLLGCGFGLCVALADFSLLGGDGPTFCEVVYVFDLLLVTQLLGFEKFLNLGDLAVVHRRDELADFLHGFAGLLHPFL